MSSKRNKILKELLSLSKADRDKILSFFDDNGSKPKKSPASNKRLHLQADYWQNVVANIPALQQIKRQLASKTAAKQD